MSGSWGGDPETTTYREPAALVRMPAEPEPEPEPERPGHEDEPLPRGYARRKSDGAIVNVLRSAGITPQSHQDRMERTWYEVTR